jgi:hypothetical protein
MRASRITRSCAAWRSTDGIAITGALNFDRADARKSVRFHPVSTLDEVFEVALLPADKLVGTPKQIIEEEEEGANGRKRGSRGSGRWLELIYRMSLAMGLRLPTGASFFHLPDEVT